MSQQPASGDVVFYVESTGVKVAPGQALVNGVTYYAELAGATGPWSAVQWKWDSAIVITSITIESCNFGDRRQEGEPAAAFGGGVDVWELAAVGWHPEAAIAAVVVPGGTAGTYMTQIGGGGQRRFRAKVIVGATGGKLRGRYHHKAG